MLRTIILDAYKESEKKEIAEAIDELCNPNDNYGWASTGVYCFWNYYTHEVYYIGLAVDLTERFKQHNGFYPSINPNSCKKIQIENYFKSNEKLGFSIIVQSTISQPLTSKQKDKFKDFNNLFTPIENYIGNEGKEAIKFQEGLLIETFRKVNGKLPKWNRMNGAIEGQEASKIINFETIKVLSNLNPHYLMSRSSLRELAKSATLERYENFLHAVRLLTPLYGIKKSINYLREDSCIDTYGEMEKNGYLTKKLSI